MERELRVLYFSVILNTIVNLLTLDFETMLLFLFLIISAKHSSFAVQFLAISCISMLLSFTLC